MTQPDSPPKNGQRRPGGGAFGTWQDDARPNRDSEAAPCWQQPPDGQRRRDFFPPPSRFDPKAEALLTELRANLKSNPLQSLQATWYCLRAAEAYDVYQMAEREARLNLQQAIECATAEQARCETEQQAAREEEKQAEADLETARAAFGKTAADAGLECEPTTPQPGEAVRLAVERAAKRAAEYAPPDGTPGRWQRGFQSLLGLTAPVASGTMLALSLGNLVGLLSISDLQRGDRHLQLVVAMGLGAVIVGLTGELVAGTVGIAARALEHVPGDVKRPRLRAAWVMAALLIACSVVCGSAEIAAEAYGIRELHRQRIVEAQQLGGGEGEQLLGAWLYVLMGTLISFPFLAHKAAAAWSLSETSGRSSWRRHRQQAACATRFDSAGVKAAFAGASTVECAQARLGALRDRTARLEARRAGLQVPQGYDPAVAERLDLALAAAIGMSQDADAYIGRIVSREEPDSPWLRLWGALPRAVVRATTREGQTT